MPLIQSHTFKRELDFINILHEALNAVARVNKGVLELFLKDCRLIYFNVLQ